MMDKETVLKLVELYEKILHGNEKPMGLFDCYDSYYSGSWDEDLKDVEKLKKKIVKK